jgi:hypothetical protein
LNPAGTIDDAGFRADLAAISQNDYPPVQLVKLPFNWFAPQVGGIIQTALGAGIATNTPTTITFANPTKNGNAILLFWNAHINGGSGFPTISDTQGNTYTFVGLTPSTSPVTGFANMRVYIATGIAGGNDTITINNAGVNFWDPSGAMAIEIGGVTGVRSFSNNIGGAGADAGPAFALPGDLAFTFGGNQGADTGVDNAAGWDELLQGNGAVYASSRLVDEAATPFVQARVSALVPAASSVPLAFASNVNVGDLIVVYINMNSTIGQSGAVTDNQGNTYTLGQFDGGDPFNNDHAMWWANAKVSGALTVTAAIGTPADTIIAIHEFTGLVGGALGVATGTFWANNEQPPTNPLDNTGPYQPTANGVGIVCAAIDTASSIDASGMTPMLTFQSAGLSLATFWTFVDTTPQLPNITAPNAPSASMFEALGQAFVQTGYSELVNRINWGGGGGNQSDAIVVLEGDFTNDVDPSSAPVTAIALNGPMNILALVSEAIDEQGNYAASNLIGQQGAAGWIRINGPGNVWVPLSFADPLTPGYVTTQNNYALCPLAGTGFSELEAPFHRLDWRPASPTFYSSTNPPSEPNGYLLAFVSMSMGVGAKVGDGNSSTYAIPSSAGPVVREKAAGVLP